MRIIKEKGPTAGRSVKIKVMARMLPATPATHKPSVSFPSLRPLLVNMLFQELVATQPTTKLQDHARFCPAYIPASLLYATARKLGY